MMQVLKGNYRKAAEAVVIAAGLYVLLRLFLFIVDPPFVLPAIMVIFILYCIFVYPRADRFLDRKLTSDSGGELEKTVGDGGKDEKMSCNTGRWDFLYFLSVTVLTFLVLHFLVLYMHEFSHSFAAYFLGAKSDPYDIIWGINMFGSHCDENVNYDALFMAGKGSCAAAIAFAGPLSNIVLFIATAALLTLGWVKKHPFAYHTIFWASGITFIMIFEYVFTRSFMNGDDFGNIVHGLGISPYLIFILGMIPGLAGLWYILTVMVPEHYRIVTPGDLPKQYVTIASLSFVFFLIYLGIRILDYPEVPQWWCGWAGIFALFIVPLLVSPMRQWVRKKTGQ